MADHQRADARRNYARILAVAEEEVATHGAGASLEQIARAAGVGSATVRRHFPTRRALLEAVSANGSRHCAIAPASWPARPTVAARCSTGWATSSPTASAPAGWRPRSPTTPRRATRCTTTPAAPHWRRPESRCCAGPYGTAR